MFIVYLCSTETNVLMDLLCAVLEEVVSLEDEQKVERIVEEASGRKIVCNFRFLSYHLKKNHYGFFALTLSDPSLKVMVLEKAISF